MFLRSILAVLAAVLANVLIVSVCEMGLSAAFPPPPGLDLSNPEQLKIFARSMPLGALAILVAGWAAGAFGSAAIGYLIGRKTWTAWVGPMFNLLGVGMSIAMIPHPLWVVCIGLLVPFLAGWAVPRVLGGRTPPSLSA